MANDVDDGGRESENESPHDPFVAALNSALKSSAEGLNEIFHQDLVPLRLGEESINFRCNFLAIDGTGSAEVGRLARWLEGRIIHYCIPRTRIKKAHRRFEKDGDVRHFTDLQREARQLFSDVHFSGEPGELLLFCLLESWIGAPQLLSKMAIKSNSRMHFHGIDGIHARATTSGALELYWGEAKFHDSPTQAMDDAFKSVEPYLISSRKGEFPRDLLLARDFLDMGQRKVTAKVMKYFDEYEPESRKVEYKAVCLVGFSQDEYPNFETATREISDVWKAKVEVWRSRALSTVEKRQLKKFDLELICLPFPDVDIFRDRMMKEIGIERLQKPAQSRP